MRERETGREIDMNKTSYIPYTTLYIVCLMYICVSVCERVFI